MPEDRTDQSDVKEEVATEVAAAPEDSSTEGNRNEAVDAESASTKKQPEATPERTVSLKAHIAERTKNKTTIADQAARIAELEKADRPEIPKTRTEKPKIDDRDIDYDPNLLGDEKAKFFADEAVSNERQRVANEASRKDFDAKSSKLDQSAAALANDVPEYAELVAANGSTGHGDDIITAAIVESEVGAELDYYLLAHPAEAIRISELSERGKLMAMGTLESKAVEFAKESKKGAANSTTNAPRPIETLTTGGGPTGDVRYDPDVSMGDFYEAYNSG